MENQKLFDEGLRRRFAPAALADLDDPGVGPRVRQAAAAHQVVDQDHLGGSQCARRFERHQFRIAGPRTNQEDLAHHLSRLKTKSARHLPMPDAVVRIPRGYLRNLYAMRISMTSKAFSPMAALLRCTKCNYAPRRPAPSSTRCATSASVSLRSIAIFLSVVYAASSSSARLFMSSPFAFSTIFRSDSLRFASASWVRSLWKSWKRATAASMIDLIRLRSGPSTT